MTVDELISALQNLKFEWGDAGYRLGEHQVIALHYSGTDETITSVHMEPVSGNIRLCIGDV